MSLWWLSSRLGSEVWLLGVRVLVGLVVALAAESLTQPSMTKPSNLTLTLTHARKRNQ